MLELYRIDNSYLNYLRTYDTKVIKNHGIDRPYVGILLNIITRGQIIEYFAPLSSPKHKHLKMKNTIDFIKIDNGQLGAINLNNMIPLVSNYYSLIDINKVTPPSYKNLLIDQITWIRGNQNTIITRAKNLHNKMIADVSTLNTYEIKVKSRCCDFLLLEGICDKYNNQTQNTQIK